MTDPPVPQTKHKQKSWFRIASGIFGCTLLILLIAAAIYFGSQSSNPPKPIERTLPYRLPKSVKPLSYDLKLQTFFPLTEAQWSPELNFTFKGVVHIKVKCLEAVSEIMLHSKSLSIDESTLTLKRDANGENIKFKNPVMFVDKRVDMVAFSLHSLLTPTEVYTLSIDFEGKLLDDLKGFYRTSYVTNGEKRWMLITQFEADYARRAFPCFDEPEMKATFTVTIVHPKPTKAVSNMPEAESVTLNSTWQMTTFPPSPMMSTYLLAFGVTDFARVSHTDASGIQHSVWCRESEKSNTQFALYANPVILERYAHLFGQKYPLPKLDTFAVPDFKAGAMENWGLITYREAYVLLDESKPDSVSLAGKMLVANIIAHELAHQWFGNLVTMAWWDSLWLNEGFATYISYDGAQVALPDWENEMAIQFVVSVIQLAMYKDELPSSTPIHRVETEMDLELYFDAITYQKGASVIGMLHMVLNDHFYTGLRRYMVVNAYKNTEERDLWNAFQEAVDNSTSPPLGWDHSSGVDVNAFMNNWVNVEGFPVVRVIRVNESHVQLIQERFMSNLYDEARSINTSAKHQWYIPFWYSSCNKTNGFTWLQPNQSAWLELESRCWFTANVGVKSFIRVLYPLGQRPVDLLSKQQIKKLPPVDVSQMIDDAFNLAKAGYVPYNATLDIPVTLLDGQSHAVPWQTAFIGYEFLKRMLANSPEALSLLRNFLGRRVPYDDNAWESSPNYHKQSMNDFVIQSGCRWVDACEKMALQQFSYFYRKCANSNETSSRCSPLIQSVRSTVYCSAVRIDDGNFDLFWKLCEKEVVNTEKRRLLMALTCTTNRTNLQRLLQSSIELNTDCIKLQDVGIVYGYMSKNIKSYQTVWTFMKDNWQKYFEKDMKMTLRTLVTTSISMFTSEEDLKQTEEFMQRSDVVERQEFFKKLLEPVKVNKLWRDRYMTEVVNWLRAY